MLGKVSFVLAFVAVVISYHFYLQSWGNEYKADLLANNEHCDKINVFEKGEQKPLLGFEDLRFYLNEQYLVGSQDKKNWMFLATSKNDSYYNRIVESQPQGHIVIAETANPQKHTVCKVEGFPWLDFHPHGIFVHHGNGYEATDSHANDRLFVVNHVRERAQVEEFAIKIQKEPFQCKLTYKSTARDESDEIIRSINSVVATSQDELWVTMDLYSPLGSRRLFFEHMTFRPNSYLVRCVRERVISWQCSAVTTVPFLYANGINAAGNLLFVADSTGKLIKVIHREPGTSHVTYLGSAQIHEISPDNIGLHHKSGDIVTGGHQKMFTFLKHAHNESASALSPSLVLRVHLKWTPEQEKIIKKDKLSKEDLKHFSPEKNIPHSSEVVHGNDGSLLSGCSTGALTSDGKHAFVGGVLTPGFLKCQVDPSHHYYVAK